MDEHRESQLGRAFDNYQNMQQIVRCIREVARQLDIKNPRVLELSRYDTELIAFMPEVEIVRFPTHVDDQPILTIPVSLPFDDRSFDFCIVTDAYEHIACDARPSFLEEMIRVTSGLALMGCPHGNEVVNRFDQIVFDFIWGKYHERFEPLEQHHDFGLDSVQDIEALIKAKGALDVVALPCNYVYRWIHMILVYFDFQHRNANGDLFQKFNRVYNEHLSPYDYREPCYRYLMVGSCDPAIDIVRLTAVMKAPVETPPQVRETEGALLEVYRDIRGETTDRLAHFTTELATAHAELGRLRGENDRLTGLIENLQKDNAIAHSETGRLTQIAAELQEHNTRANSDIETLSSVITTLQRDNAWANQEIERVSAFGIRRQEHDTTRAEIARLEAIIESLQRDNAWALDEIKLQASKVKLK